MTDPAGPCRPKAAAPSPAGVSVSAGDGFNGIAIEVARVAAAVERRVAAWRDDGLSVGLVPVLGEPHVGHLALISTAAAECARTVVVSQSGADILEDAAGLRLLSERGADLLFLCPEIAGGAVGRDEPASSPGDRVMEREFDAQGFGRCVECLRRWVGRIQPDRVYQTGARFQIAHAVAAHLAGAGVEMRVVESARGPGGITPDARIDRLGEAGRDKMSALHKVLTRMAARLSDGASTADAEIAWGRHTLRAAGILTLDYLDIRDGRTLAPAERMLPTTRIFVAAHIGGTRLVDSVPLVEPAAIRTVAAGR